LLRATGEAASRKLTRRRELPFAERNSTHHKGCGKGNAATSPTAELDGFYADDGRNWSLSKRQLGPCTVTIFQRFGAVVHGGDGA
jgi:hypothetical protein